MSYINQIRQDLLVAREELHEELATVDRALQALGNPVEEKPAKKRAPRSQAPPSPRLLKAAEKTLRSTDRPLTTAELAKHGKVSSSAMIRALRQLEQEGKIQVVGKAPGRGRTPLWEMKKKEKPEMESDLAPSKQDEQLAEPREPARWGA